MYVCWGSCDRTVRRSNGELAIRRRRRRRYDSNSQLGMCGTCRWSAWLCYDDRQPTPPPVLPSTRQSHSCIHTHYYCSCVCARVRAGENVLCFCVCDLCLVHALCIRGPRCPPRNLSVVLDGFSSVGLALTVTSYDGSNEACGVT